MKKNDVPQDDENLLEGKFGKVNYALDDQGNYIQVTSKGWEPENIALKQAWQEINSELEDIHNKIKTGALSPIAYFMNKNMMDINILASALNKWQWQVKRHLKPDHFKSLDQAMLAKYAKVFNITIKKKKNFK